MADILIRGMKMPLSKTELIVFPSGVVQVYDSRENYLGKAQAVPLPEGVRGKWEFKNTDTLASKAWTCSECGRRKAFKTNFCPACGADMRPEGRTET